MNSPNLMVSVDGNEAISFVEFCEINDFDFSKRVDMLVDLQVDGHTVYGGGASPEVVIKAVDG